MQQTTIAENSPFVLWHGIGKLDDATNCAFGVKTTKRAAGNGLSKKSSTTSRYSSVSSSLPHFSGFNFRLFCTKPPMYSSRKSDGASEVVISVYSGEGIIAYLILTIESHNRFFSPTSFLLFIGMDERNSSFDPIHCSYKITPVSIKR